MTGRSAIVRKLASLLALFALVVSGSLAAGRYSRTQVVPSATGSSGAPEEEEEERQTPETSKKLGGSEALFKHHRGCDHLPSPERTHDEVREAPSRHRPVILLANVTPSLPRRLC
jgi:hypothetical protein